MKCVGSMSARFDAPGTRVKIRRRRDAGPAASSPGLLPRPVERPRQPVDLGADLLDPRPPPLVAPSAELGPEPMALPGKIDIRPLRGEREALDGDGRDVPGVDVVLHRSL